MYIFDNRFAKVCFEQMGGTRFAQPHMFGQIFDADAGCGPSSMYDLIRLATKGGPCGEKRSSIIWSIVRHRERSR